MRNIVEIGKWYEARYPRSNVKGAGSKLERRRFRVEAIRDPELHPLSEGTVASAPGIRREGVLVIAFDLDRQARRQFWSGQLRDLRETPAPPQPVFGVAMVEASAEITVVYETADLGLAAKVARETRARVESMGVTAFVRVERVA